MLVVCCSLQDLDAACDLCSHSLGKGDAAICTLVGSYTMLEDQVKEHEIWLAGGL